MRTATIAEITKAAGHITADVRDRVAVHRLGGDIHATNGATTASVIRGEIRRRWEALGGSHGPLGAPTADEQDAGTHGGRFVTFAGGAIYWSAPTGAWEVTGAILVAWQSRFGGVTGPYGFPTSAPTTTPASGETHSNFEGGVIVLHREGKTYGFNFAGEVAVRADVETDMAGDDAGRGERSRVEATELQIHLDGRRVEAQAAEIIETEYFRQLRATAACVRARRGAGGSDGTVHHIATPEGRAPR